MKGWQSAGVAIAIVVAAATPCMAETPRDLLTQASFGDHDRATALGRINMALQSAAAVLRNSPGDPEAGLMHATAIGYHAKLTGSRGEAVAARRSFEALVRRNPRNAEAQLALGAWHLGAVQRLGRLVGRAALGAQKPVGLSALDQAVALGGNRAMFSGLAALLRLQMDPDDARGRALAEAAARAATPTPIDRIVQRAAAQMTAALRKGDENAVRKLAMRSLPFGQLPGES